MATPTEVELERGEWMNITVVANDDNGTPITMDGTYTLTSLARHKRTNEEVSPTVSLSGGNGVVAHATATMALGDWLWYGKIVYPTGEPVYAGPILFTLVEPNL